MPERGSNTSTVPVVWATFGIFLARSKSFPVATGDHGRNLVMSLWLGDKATINGVAAYRLAPPQNIPSAKNRWESSRLDFFLNQDGILHIDYLPQGQTINAEHYSSLLVQLMAFWRKNAAGRSPRGSCCTTMPRLTGHLQPRRSWTTWTSNVLITHPILRTWPCRTTTCSLDWKNNWKVAVFRPTRRALLPRRPGWTDNLLIFFFEWLAKVRATV